MRSGGPTADLPLAVWTPATLRQTAALLLPLLLARSDFFAFSWSEAEFGLAQPFLDGLLD